MLRLVLLLFCPSRHKKEPNGLGTRPMKSLLRSRSSSTNTRTWGELRFWFGCAENGWCPVNPADGQKDRRRSPRETIMDVSPTKRWFYTLALLPKLSGRFGLLKGDPVRFKLQAVVHLLKPLQILFPRGAKTRTECTRYNVLGCAIVVPGTFQSAISSTRASY